MMLISAARSLKRVVLLLWTAFDAALQFLYLKMRGRVSETQRAEWLHRTCKRLLRRLRIPVEHVGEIPADGLIVANHLSYLDILALSALTPCVFIAKKEVRSWTIFGWMAKTAGTLFVDRERKLETGRFNESIDQALRSGLRLVLFAEGTSSDGTGVLPFRPSLFEPAVASRARITPAWINFQASSGSVANDVCFWGEAALIPHVLRLFSIRSVSAKIHFAATMTEFQDRKQAADATRAEVLRMAGLPADGSLQPTGKIEE